MKKYDASKLGLRMMKNDDGVASHGVTSDGVGSGVMVVRVERWWYK